MTAPKKRGPYVSENGPEVWLPVSDYTLNEARHEASLHAQETIGDWGRARYLGKQAVPLHDHDGWEFGCYDCPEQAAWAFETYEGTWRR